MCGGACTIQADGQKEPTTCPDCSGRGYDLIDRCPFEYLDPEFSDLLIFVDFAKQGVMPIGVGALEQSQWFLNFARSVWSEDSRAGAYQESDVS